MLSKYCESIHACSSYVVKLQSNAKSLQKNLDDINNFGW